MQLSDDQVAPVLVGGRWQVSGGTKTFEGTDPVDGRTCHYPVSSWADVNEALAHGEAAFFELAELGPDTWASFLEHYAEAIDGSAAKLASVAEQETALAATPRLLDIEIPRTTNQLRQAASASRSRSWTLPTISPSARVASYLAPISGVAVVFGPNNFPFAFNSAAGGDFAAAIATGHPVIAKGNPGHPETTRILAELARETAGKTGAPESILQLLYRLDPRDGARLVADQRVAATAFTGSRRGGLSLKAAADGAGRPIYLEMSSINPVIVLEGALRERNDSVARELADAVLTGAGQFCTSPGLILVPHGDSGDIFAGTLGRLLAGAPSGYLLDDRVRKGLENARASWVGAGAQLVAQAESMSGHRQFPNTLMSVGQTDFLTDPEALQEEAFGNMTLLVRVDGASGARAVVEALEGSLTGCIYSATDGSDKAYDVVSSSLRRRVGRLLNDKAPTGVAVVEAMNHGGPYPATGHPGFTAVGIPASLRRFGMLQSFDAVRPERLPLELQPSNPLGIQRFVDGEWTRDPTTAWGKGRTDPDVEEIDS